MFLIRKFLFYIIFTILSVSQTNAQVTSGISENEFKWFVSLNSGYQMSGIKDEDFISSNYSPLFNVSLGKWISPYFAFQAGYKGFTIIFFMVK